MRTKRLGTLLLLALVLVLVFIPLNSTAALGPILDDRFWAMLGYVYAENNLNSCTLEHDNPLDCWDEAGAVGEALAQVDIACNIQN